MGYKTNGGGGLSLILRTSGTRVSQWATMYLRQKIEQNLMSGRSLVRVYCSGRAEIVGVLVGQRCTDCSPWQRVNMTRWHRIHPPSLLCIITAQSQRRSRSSRHNTTCAPHFSPGLYILLALPLPLPLPVVGSDLSTGGPLPLQHNTIPPLITWLLRLPSLPNLKPHCKNITLANRLIVHE